MSLDHDALVQAAKNGLNVLLVGRHGVGKTMIVRKIFQDLRMVVKYYSASTIDPWADLVGIPVPITVKNGEEHKELEFVRPKAVDAAEVLFFDELNRAHPKVLNAVMEIVQFKSINGVKLPKLRMVWAAINPPGGNYQVNDLDPALADRFQIHMEVLPDPSREYLLQFAPPDAVDAILQWWQGLEQKHKDVITPRRLEYLCAAARSGVPLTHLVPYGNKIPIQSLQQMLRGKKRIAYASLKDPDFKKQIIDKLQQGDMETQIEVTKALLDLTTPQLSSIIDVFEQLSKEARARVFSSKTTGARVSHHIDTYYPTDKPLPAETHPSAKRLIGLYREFKKEAGK